MPKTAELVLDAKALVGEGAIWDADANCLYWIDIESHELHIYDPAAATDKVYNVGQRVGTVVLRKSGGLMLALHQGFAAYDPQTEALTLIHDPEADRPEMRFNDGKCDPAGRFWAGTMNIDAKTLHDGALYRMDTDLTVNKMLDKVSISNGIVWTSDGSTMYYVDTFTGRVDAFDYDLDTGDIANRRPAVNIPESDGYPDGMAIDTEDMIWVAQFGGGAVHRWDPKTGKKLDTISLPARQITSCAFGGPELNQLYITTARFNLSDEDLKSQPLAGALFLATPGVQGVLSVPFAG